MSRQDALKWWRAMTPQQQIQAIKQWKSQTTDSRKEWSIDFIAASSSTIEEMWRELGEAKQQQ